MEIIIVYWRHIGIMAKKMESKIVCWENNRDSGKEDGSYCSGFRALALIFCRAEPNVCPLPCM